MGSRRWDPPLRGDDARHARYYTDDGGDGGGGDGDGNGDETDPMTFGSQTRGPIGGDGLRSTLWLGGAVLLAVLALATAALAMAIWAVVVTSNNSRRLDDAIEGDLIMERAPTEAGHMPQWDPETRSWQPGHVRLDQLKDVRLGSPARPLEEGDLLRWEAGHVVNSRDRSLEHTLNQHIDVRRSVRLRTGDIYVYNGTGERWEPVALSALLSLAALHDVDLSVSPSTTAAAAAAAAIPHESTLVRDVGTGRWTVRRPLARAYLRFGCATGSDSDGGNDSAFERWGIVDGIKPNAWIRVQPSAPAIGVYAIDAHSTGEMRISRAHVSLITPRADRGARPSATGTPYLLRASFSARGFPEGTWGFLVGAEASPSDGGFELPATRDIPIDHMAVRVREDGTTSSSKELYASTAHWTIESLRHILPDQEIWVAFRAHTAMPAQAFARIQCLQFSAEAM